MADADCSPSSLRQVWMQSGCSRGTRYCPAHEKAHRQADDARRGSAYSRGYDRTWQKVRDRFLVEHPLCCMCEAEGRVSAASVVDHIEAIKDRPELRLEVDNLRSLCKPHHDQRTGRDQGWGRGGRTLQVGGSGTVAPIISACPQNRLTR